MEISSIALLGLGGAGLIGAIFLLLTKFFGRSSKDKLTDIIKSNFLKTKEQENIESVTKEQEIIIKQIKVAEVSSEETREKVKTIVREASKDIQIILNNSTIADIDKQIKEDWEDI